MKQDTERDTPFVGGIAVHSSRLGRFLFGVILLFIGFVWTLDNFGFLDADDILRWWPGLLAAAGVWRMLGIGGRHQFFSGFLFFVAGSLLVLREADAIRLRFWDLWPIFLMLIGAAVVIRSMRDRNRRDESDTSEDMNIFALMGGVTRRSESTAFRGGEVTAIMAGAEIDLRNARTDGKDVVIDVFTWWAGIEIYVPPHWQVVSEVTPILGGVEDQSRFIPSGQEPGRLIVRGLVVMGGVDIKN